MFSSYFNFEEILFVFLFLCGKLVGAFRRARPLSRAFSPEPTTHILSVYTIIGFIQAFYALRPLLRFRFRPLRADVFSCGNRRPETKLRTVGLPRQKKTPTGQFKRALLAFHHQLFRQFFSAFFPIAAFRFSNLFFILRLHWHAAMLRHVSVYFCLCALLSAAQVLAVYRCGYSALRPVCGREGLIFFFTTYAIFI